VRSLVVEHDHDDVAEIVRVRFPERPTLLSYLGLVTAALTGAVAARKRGFRPDIVHAHFITAAIPAALLSVIWRRRLIVSEHWSVFLPEDPATLARPLQLAARLALARAEIVLPVSAALERGLRRHGITAPMRVVPNAVDTETFHPPDAQPPGTPPRLLTVALFYEAKGIDLLLDAVRQIDLPVHLDVVGDGLLRSVYEGLSAGLDVTFHGVLPKAEVAQLMRMADLYVLPSRFDNNPVALLEALASGLPCVATRVGGVPDVVGENDGLLVAPTTDEIADGICNALRRIGTFDRVEIGERAAARFGSAAVGSVYASLYAGR
jgi:glycosyltransferase involved in cell wall biosynthesis